MNTDSFKQRQLIFQNSGANQGNAKSKLRQSVPLMNKDNIISKINNNTTNTNKNAQQETNNSLKKNNISSNAILKIANQMENKNKNQNEPKSNSKNTNIDKIQKNIKKESSKNLDKIENFLKENKKEKEIGNKE